MLIINPNSGGGKSERFNLIEEASSRNIETLRLGRGDDLHELARRAVARGADVIGMAGGDGSQAVVASVAMQHDVAHVCVPAGTRNHFAADLGLDRNDVVGALDAFTDGVERRVDLASLNERVFVNNVSLGVYAQVVQSDAYRDAKLRTWRRRLPEVLGTGPAVSELSFDAPHPRDWSDAALVIVSNNPYQVRRFRGTGTRPRLDTGQLGVFAARLHGAGGVARLVTFGTIGRSLGSGSQHRRLSGVLQWSCLEFEVAANRTCCHRSRRRVAHTRPTAALRRLAGRPARPSAATRARCFTGSGGGSTHPTQPRGAASDRGRAARPVAVAEVTGVTL